MGTGSQVLPSQCRTNKRSTLCTNERVLLVEGRQLTSSVCFVDTSQLLILEKKRVSEMDVASSRDLVQPPSWSWLRPARGLQPAGQSQAPLEGLKSFLERKRACGP